MLNVRISRAYCVLTESEINIVDADVPPLLGLSDLQKCELLLNYVEDRLIDMSLRPMYLAKYRHSYCFIEGGYTNKLLSRQELQRPDPHFLLPITDKLFQLLKRGGPERQMRNQSGYRKTLQGHSKKVWK